MKCRICDNSDKNKTYEVKEMMFGFPEKFNYFECAQCGCLQIAEFPSDISKYYPSNYYSFLSPSPESSGNRIGKLLKKLRDKYALSKKGMIGKLVYNRYPNDPLRILSQVSLRKNSRIIDVGCGSGPFLYALSEIGYKNLLGVDPFIKNDIEYGNGLKIHKKTIHEVYGKWDLIMFHHSFEHMPDFLETLHSVSRLLDDGGICYIRIPTVSSYAWKHYKENWVQLDAPRHLFLHSIESMTILAEKANLVLVDVVYESHDLQFWGSEQYLRGITFTDPRSYFSNPTDSIFSKEEINSFKQKAKKLNSENRGDSAVFFLRKK